VIGFDTFEILSFSVATVNGTPAIAHSNNVSGLTYRWSTTTDGSSFVGNEHPVGAVVGGGYGASLAEVDGAPAIAYHDYASGHVMYVDSELSGGTPIWHPAINIAATASVAMCDGLLLLPTGQPLVVYHDRAGQAVMYVKAVDHTGDLWGLPTNIGDTGGEAGLVPRIALAGSTAHIFYYDFTADALKHCESADPWDSFTPLETVASNLDGSVGLSAADLGGYPGVAYVNSVGEPRLAIKY
jgi:hypothetical protein